MGQRCNLVIIEGGRTTVYYDHWAANRLDLELFWGPEIARTFIEERDPNPDSWLNNAWAEGGCVLDFDSRHLLWYGGEDILFVAEMNLIHHEMMINQWLGWRVEWAKDGIFDIARKTGVSIESVSTDNPDYPEKIAQPHIYESGDLSYFYANNIVSYIRQTNLKWAVLNGDVGGLAHPELTPSALVDLVDGFSERDFESGKSLDPGWGQYNWGVHLNFDSLSLDYWNAKPSEGLLNHTKRKWPTWTIVEHGPNYLWHKALVPSKDWPAISDLKKRRLLQAYGQNLSRARTNPIVSAAAAISKSTDQTIQINAQTLEHREGDQMLLQTKLAILAKLEEKLT